MSFKRKASVEVTLNNSGKKFKIEGLRIAFNCFRNFTDTPNICDVKIYNLSEYTRGQFHELGDEIIVNVGYETDQGEQILFIANSQRVYHQYAIPDIVTTIEGLDADLFSSIQPISGSYKDQVSALQVLNAVARQMETRTVILPNNITDKIYYQGFSYDGAASAVLTKLAEFLGLTWSFQNKTLQFTKAGEALEEPPVQLNAETGMIYYPEILKDLPLKIDPQTNRRLIGWRVRSLLNPRIKPNGKVQIYSSKTPQLNGIYVVQSVRHVGDTHGQNWETIAEMIQS